MIDQSFLFSSLWLVNSCFSIEPGIGPQGPEGKKGSAGKLSEVMKNLFSVEQERSKCSCCLFRVCWGNRSTWPLWSTWSDWFCGTARIARSSWSSRACRLSWQGRNLLWWRERAEGVAWSTRTQRWTFWSFLSRRYLHPCLRGQFVNRKLVNLI